MGGAGTPERPLRIALVGDGPLPGADVADTGFAQLRFHQFRETLREEHTLGDAGDPEADVVVSAGTWGPTQRALACAGSRPLCIDLPGDPFADAQAMAAHGDVEAVADAAAAVFVPALLRGDAFTTISGPSRHSLVGQLGAVGRLARSSADEWAWVTPVAWAFPGLDEGPIRSAGSRVALVGSFNTWFDDETLLRGLLLAMDRGPTTVRVLGGPVPGHFETGYLRFRSSARASRHAARFEFRDRVAARELGRALADCHLGVVLNRPGYEPELGSRTRLLLYLHQGLRVVATSRCELARELAQAGFLTEVPIGDADAVARAVGSGPELPDRALLRERYSLARTTAGLRAWAAAPRRRTVWGDAEVLAALMRERDALREELRAVRDSPTWRLLDGLRRRGRRADTP